VIKGDKAWGASYDLEVSSDSGPLRDLDLTKIAEDVTEQSATGIFEGAEIAQADFLPSTKKQDDSHVVGDGTAANLIEQILTVGPDKSKHVTNQLFRFSCRRTGIAEDKAKAPKVPISGFQSQVRTFYSRRKFFIGVTNSGHAHDDVAAGTVRGAKEKSAEIKD